LGKIDVLETQASQEQWKGNDPAPCYKSAEESKVTHWIKKRETKTGERIGDLHFYLFGPRVERMCLTEWMNHVSAETFSHLRVVKKQSGSRKRKNWEGVGRMGLSRVKAADRLIPIRHV